MEGKQADKFITIYRLRVFMTSVVVLILCAKVFFFNSPIQNIIRESCFHSVPFVPNRAVLSCHCRPNVLLWSDDPARSRTCYLHALFSRNSPVNYTYNDIIERTRFSRTLLQFMSGPQFEKGGYSDHASYSLSKLLDIMFNMELARRAPEGVTCNSLDPGTVDTKMLRAGWGMGGIPVGRYYIFVRLFVLG